jgi:hypothetical protein
MALVKSLGTYLCWTQMIVKDTSLHVLNCYLEPQEGERVRNQTSRILEIVRDMIKQDRDA